MKILILTDGHINNGGYSTIADVIYKNINDKYDVDFYTFILTNASNFESHEIHIEDCNNDLLTYRNLNSKFNKKYNVIICTSPWAFYISSLFFNKIRTIYIKGGGLKTDKYITNLSDTYILNTNVDNYLDLLTITLEKKATDNLIKYVVIPSTNLVYEILMKSSNYKYIKDSLTTSLNFAWFENKLINNTNIEKEYDLIFVVSDHKRIVKNSSFAYKIFETNPNLTKIVIGMNCEHYNILPNTTVINKYIENNEVKKMFKKSRILLVPSYYDSGPSTIVEAVLQNCISICYHNCGFSLLNINCLVMKNIDVQKWNYSIHNTLLDFDKIEFNNIQSYIKNSVNDDVDLFFNIIISD